MFTMQKDKNILEKAQWTTYDDFKGVMLNVTLINVKVQTPFLTFI